jgi:hypothetical protein
MISGVGCLARGALVAASLSTAAPALELITEQEAALPDALGANFQLGFRGVTRGPKVLIISPAPDAGAVGSPLDLLLRFEVHSSALIELQSVTMTYLKKPAINLTPRISDLIKESGINVYSAQVPPGTHYIKIEVKDNAGRLGSTTFALIVAK